MLLLRQLQCFKRLFFDSACSLVVGRTQPRARGVGVGGTNAHPWRRAMVAILTVMGYLQQPEIVDEIKINTASDFWVQ